MADGNVLGIFTQKVGPLPGWGWAGIVGVGALALMSMKGKKTPTTAGGGAGGPGGQYASNQSQETVDPVTGKRTTSSYQASGPTNGWGGSTGLPMAYPMPYSGGDVFVNLPGDTQNLNPGVPGVAGPAGPAGTAGRGLHFPPKTGPGFTAGSTTGGYWFTPQNRDDVWWTVVRSGAYPQDALDNMSPDAKSAAQMSMYWARIVASNPQIDWGSKYKLTDWIGTPIYIPQGEGYWGRMPPGASLNAPEGYTPPPQQTTVSSG